MTHLIKEYLDSIIFAWKNPGKILLTVLFDILFLSIALLISNYLNISFPKDAEAIRTMFGSQAKIFTAIIIYYLGILLIYSFFKFLVIEMINSETPTGSEKFGNKIKSFFEFFAMNLVLCFVLLIIAAIINYIMSGIEPRFIKYYTVILIIPYIMISYVFVNFGHSIFMTGHKIWSAITGSLRTTFSRNWLSLFVFNILVMIIYFVIYALFSFLFNKFGFGSRFTETYNTFSSIATFIIFYILFIINRVYFLNKIIRKA